MAGTAGMAGMRLRARAQREGSMLCWQAEGPGVCPLRADGTQAQHIPVPGYGILKGVKEMAREESLEDINRATAYGFLTYMQHNPVYFRMLHNKPCTDENIRAAFKDQKRRNLVARAH